jgi:uncharacterized protein (TIGR02217 family)
MAYWLAPAGAARTIGHLKRFDPRYWTVNFPRPMMASVVTTGANSLRVDAAFYGKSDLAGLIWEAEDRHDHPLLRYETARDFRRCRLSFRWRSGGLKPLDALHGPTLTIEGRDEAGQPRSWYVRLWNYAQGTPEDARISLDLDAIDGGFLLPSEADPVWAGDVDRMFISLVAPEYDGSGGALGVPAEGWAELSEIDCDGSGSVLNVGDPLVPEHRLRIATGYDDLYHLTPARVLRNVLQLGYRGLINHYVGMSHYFRLGADGEVAGTGAALNGPCEAWHRDLAARAAALGYDLILSLSYELLDMHCPEPWKQRFDDGAPALTGWVPPSALLSPANADAMGYLRRVARAFANIVLDAGLPVRFQVGEPWWWVAADGRIALYDDAARAAFAPAAITDVRAPLGAEQRATLDAAGAVLAGSTAALCDAVRGEAPGAETLLLIFLPTVLDGADVKRANVPVGWAAPAFDVLQLEDYDWVTSGRGGWSEAAVAEMAARLGYPVPEQHYLSGFVLRREDRALWPPIAQAVDAARARGTGEVFVWALPQVMRDGFTWFDPSAGSGWEGDVEAFDDVRFPVALGREASVEPAFSTAVVTTTNGVEQRNSEWADARLRFDAGPGVRGEAELQELLAFFRARRGAAIGFRFEDPFDHEAQHELVGVGDGNRTEFPLVKHYGAQERRITLPVASSVRVFVGGAERVSGWSLAEKGIVRFAAAVPAGAEVRASFRFDVPVRFAEDVLRLSRATFAAGEAASVPLIEIREA